MGSDRNYSRVEVSLIVGQHHECDGTDVSCVVGMGVFQFEGDVRARIKRRAGDV